MNAPLPINEFTTGPLTLDETMKIVSLLENPPEAANVRKALRFYEMPDKHYSEYKWGGNQELMRALHHYACPQDAEELKSLLALVDGKTSLLEVGSSFGGTLKRMASVMRKGSIIVSVDLPIDGTQEYLNPQDSLKDTCRKIALMGANVQLFIGNSHSQDVIDKVSDYGPFDFVFIDGDHSYDGMLADWHNYGPMGRVVGFHDIAGALPDCVRAWEQVKLEASENDWWVEEFINPASAIKFGIGIVHKE